MMTREASRAAAWFDAHAGRLEAADRACAERAAHSPFIESPRRALHPEGAKEAGRAAFESRLGGRVDHTGPGGVWLGGEISPYTGEPLGIAYRAPDPDAILEASLRAWPAWRDATYRERVGVCLEALDRWSQITFENAFATMHTAGQAFVMAFAGSGANSLDRGLEALVYAHRALRDVPESATFRRRFGAGEVELTKRYKTSGRGPALVIACASYPMWNAYPAIVANLATGNPVIVKPHPQSILPVARAVEILRAVLDEAGFDPDLAILAPDVAGAPITSALAEHPRTAIVDFTGSPEYGAHLERSARGLVFTETAGCNAVILESAPSLDDLDGLDAAIEAIARGLCLFSGQMCTTPQNIFIADSLGFDDTRDRLIAAVDRLVARPEVAAGLCGAICNPETIDRIAALTSDLGDGERLVRPSRPYVHPEFPAARTATPAIVEIDARAAIRSDLHRREHFGPIAFVIRAGDRERALAMAADDARERGAIASYAYSADPAYRDRVEAAFFEAGASIGFNLVGQSPINFTAAYSDYHVTGLNPAGNATLTDLSFVAGRFRIVQSKTEISRERR